MTRPGREPVRWLVVLNGGWRIEGFQGAVAPPRATPHPPVALVDFAATSGTATAAEGLAELTERRAAVQARVDQLVTDERGAREVREAARTALVQAEREGVAASQRAKLEKALTEAEARAAERWPEGLRARGLLSATPTRR